MDCDIARCRGSLRRVLLVYSAIALLAACQYRSLADSPANTDPWVCFGVPVWTNGQVQLTLSGEYGVRYVIESSPDLRNWTPVVTNDDTAITRIITVDAPDNAGFYRAVRGPIPLFAYALAARDNINMNGNGVVTDSWNSHDPNLSTNGLYISTRTGTNGSIASEQGIVFLGAKTINGDLYLGQTATNASSTNQVLGNVYYGCNVQFPDVLLPTASWRAAPITGIGTNALHDFTTSGDYLVSDSIKIVLEPGVNVRLRIVTLNFYPSVAILGGTTNSGTMTIYQDSGTATISENVSTEATRPENFIYYGLPDVTNVFVDSNSAFIGVIYAPSAIMTANGGGTNSTLMGCCITRSVTMNGHYNLHFDESLLRLGH